MTITTVRVVIGVGALLAVHVALGQYSFPGPPPGYQPPPPVGQYATGTPAPNGQASSSAGANPYASTWNAAYSSSYQPVVGVENYLPPNRQPVGGTPAGFIGGVRPASYNTQGGGSAVYSGGPVYAGGAPVAGGGSLMGGPGGPMVTGPSATNYSNGPMMPAPSYYDPSQDGSGRQWSQPGYDSQACPPSQSVGYQQSLGEAGSIGVYGGGADNPAGGARWRLGQAGFLRGAEAGVYANDDQTVFSAGATFALLDRDHFFVGARVLGNAVVYAEGNTDPGASVDLFASKRVNLGGWEHYFKVGYFYDGQRIIHRHGPEIAGILFTNDHLPDITFDVAVGIGDGQGFLDARYIEAADVETQLRGGLQFTEWLNIGVRGTFAKFDNPLLEDVGDFGAYSSIDMGNILLNLDVGGGRENARGFINVVWQPTYGYPARRPAVPSTVTQTGHDQKYAGWMSRPVLRDISMRTGTLKNQGPDPTPVGSLTDVFTVVRFPTNRANPDANANGVADAGEGFEVDFIFRNLTQLDANTVSVTTAQVNGPATLSFLGTNPTTVIRGTVLRTNASDGAVININPGASPGDVVELLFTVQADGEVRNFSFSQTVGAIVNGTTQIAIPQ